MAAFHQDGKTLENEIEVVEGMKFDRGYISPYFVTDPKTQMCELENPVILIVERKVTLGSIEVEPPASGYFSRFLSRGRIRWFLGDECGRRLVLRSSSCVQ